MNKLNIQISFVMCILLFGGCKKNDDPNYAELLEGTWVNTLVNEQVVLTDETYVMEFKPDNNELYAIGIQLDENNKSWQEINSYTYSVNGDLISIDGTDKAGNLFKMEFKIQSLNQKTITYTVPAFSINGDAFPDKKTYTCQKVTIDYREEFTGIWYGRCTTKGNTDSLYHYWEYFDDGRFNYYYQDENSNWIKKADNEGHYYLYGNLMASNYSHDLLSGGTGLAFECWNFTLNKNKMVWTGLRKNNITITYEMERVLSPPKTEQ